MTNKIFKVDDGNVIWWVSASSEKEAVNEVIRFEREAGCDLIKDGYWDEDDLDSLASELSIQEAINTAYWEEYTKVSNMLEEFTRDNSTRVIACSEW